MTEHSPEYAGSHLCGGDCEDPCADPDPVRVIRGRSDDDEGPCLICLEPDCRGFCI